MRVFTFFYNRFTTATTANALSAEGIPHTVLCHSAEDADKFIAGCTADRKNILVTGQPKGLANQRNAALSEVKKGEWTVFMCDDFQHVRMYPKEFIVSQSKKIPVNYDNQESYRLNHKKTSTLTEMFSCFPKLIQLAEDNNIHLVGFKLHDNPLGLQNKFTTRGLADGRFWLLKKAHYQFDLNAQLIDDVAWTAENLCRHGNVLVCNWILPTFKRYTAGGFGTQEERLELRRKECLYLAKKYHPLVKIAPKPGWPAGTHVRIFGADANIKIARKVLGYELGK
jgi:hypothetical protein